MARAAPERVAIADSFGPILGFGFSCALRELGLSADSGLALLAGFDLGVEFGPILKRPEICPRTLLPGDFGHLYTSPPRGEHGVSPGPCSGRAGV